MIEVARAFDFYCQLTGVNHWPTAIETHRRHTGVPKLSIKRATSFSFTKITNAIRFKVFEFVTSVKQRHPIRHIVPQCRMLGKMENVMCSKIAAFVTPALLAGEVVPEEDGVAPFLVFWAPSIVERSLCFAMCVSVVVFSPCRSFTSDFSDASTRLKGMLGTSAIASSFFLPTRSFYGDIPHSFVCLSWEGQRSSFCVAMHVSFCAWPPLSDLLLTL